MAQLLSRNAVNTSNVGIQYKSERASQLMKSAAKGPKMDFPCFNGDNSLGWIRQVNKYFELAQAPHECKVNLAQTYIVGRTNNWIRSAKLQNVEKPWEQLCRFLCERFAESNIYEMLEKFNLVKQLTLSVSGQILGDTGSGRR